MYMGSSSSQGVVSSSNSLSLYNSDSKISHGCSVDAFWPNIGGTDPANTANQNNASEADIRCNTSSSRNNKNPQTTDHVSAERKRRAKLGQQFMALRAIVPGIRKMDKVTILEDMIKYIKQLQEREKKLEEQISEKKTETVIYMKKSKNHSDSEFCASGENFTEKFQALPQIEVRISDGNVLIRIHCKTRKGVLVKVIEETEKLNLTVVNSGVIQFGTSTLDITLMAQMDGEYIMTREHTVKSLHSSLTQFMGSNIGQDSRA